MPSAASPPPHVARFLISVDLRILVQGHAAKGAELGGTWDCILEVCLWPFSPVPSLPHLACSISFSG